MKVYKGEEAVKKRENKKAFRVSDVKGICLSINDINTDMKRCNGSSIR